MSYQLCFSAEFFILPGELYDGAEYPHGDTPYSVLGALRAKTKEEWRDIAVDVFGMGDDMADHLGVESVMDMIRKVDTCGNLCAPVSVWIDPDGYYTVEVHERGERPDM